MEEQSPGHGARGCVPRVLGSAPGPGPPGRAGGCCFPFPTTFMETWRGCWCQILPLHRLQSAALAVITSKLMSIPFPQSLV